MRVMLCTYYCGLCRIYRSAQCSRDPFSGTVNFIRFHAFCWFMRNVRGINKRAAEGNEKAPFVSNYCTLEGIVPARADRAAQGRSGPIPGLLGSAPAPWKLQQVHIDALARVRLVRWLNVARKQLPDGLYEKSAGSESRIIPRILEE